MLKLPHDRWHDEEEGEYSYYHDYIIHVDADQSFRI